MSKNRYLEDSLLILDAFYSELKFYKDQINILRKHKPMFYQYNKLKKYNNELNELENKIHLCENKIKNYIDN